MTWFWTWQEKLWSIWWGWPSETKCRSLCLQWHLWDQSKVSVFANGLILGHCSRCDCGRRDMYKIGCIRVWCHYIWYELCTQPRDTPNPLMKVGQRPFVHHTWRWQPWRLLTRVATLALLWRSMQPFVRKWNLSNRHTAYNKATYPKIKHCCMATPELEWG